MDLGNKELRHQLLEEADNPSVLVDYLFALMFLAIAIVPVTWLALEDENYLVVLAFGFPIAFAILLYYVWAVFIRRPRKMRIYEDGVELVFANSKERFVPWNEILDVHLEGVAPGRAFDRQFGVGTIIMKKAVEFPFADQELPQRRVDIYSVSLNAAAKLVKYRPDKLNTGFMLDFIDKIGKEHHTIAGDRKGGGTNG